MTAPRIDRRRFLATSAAAGAALAARPLRAADDFGGFKFGVQSYTFRNFDLEPALKRINDLGLKYVEFYSKHADPAAPPEKNAAVLKLCKEYDITPIAFGVQRFSKNHDANAKIFDFAQKMGIKYLSADPDPDSFDSLDKLCEATKIAIAIHPHGPSGKGKHRWYSAEVIMAAVKDHYPLIGSCLDTGHLIRMAQLGEPLDPVAQIKVMGPRNFGMHLKDHDNKKKTDVVFGAPEGVLDVAAVLKALREVKFQGYLSIEYEANPSEPTADVKKCVAAVRDAVKKLG